jgi:hypothetical protein
LPKKIVDNIFLKYKKTTKTTISAKHTATATTITATVTPTVVVAE